MNKLPKLKQPFKSPTKKKKLSSLNLNPNHNHIHSLFSKLATCSTLFHFSQIHAKFITCGLSHNTFAASLLLKFTTSLNHPFLPLSFLIFSQIPSPDLFSFNLLFQALSNSSHPISLSISLLHRLLHQGLLPNDYTLCFLLTCAARSRSLAQGSRLHTYLVKLGFNAHLFIGTSLVHMYGNCGPLSDARKAFDEMPQRSEVTWAALMDACVINWELVEGLKLLRQMRCCGFEVGNASMVSAFGACARLGDLGVGRMVHGYVVVRGLELNLTLGTSLIDMYAKLGDVDIGMDIFRAMPMKSVGTWNCMIHGLAVNSRVDLALGLFKEMRMVGGVLPDAATFLGVLSACSHGGQVDAGVSLFSSMSNKYKITPNIKHFGCMVSLFSRAGQMEKAVEMIRSMPMKADVAIWGAMFCACKIDGYTRLGELVWAHIIKLQPHHTGGYTFLSDIYAVAKRWEDVEEVRHEMMEMDVRKEPGCSFLCA